MAYTTALDVFQRTGRVEEAEETFDSVSSGDTLELSNTYIIKDAYPSESKTAIVTVDGNVQAPSDYTVDFETNSIDYSGTDTGSATVEYKAGPFQNQSVQQSIEAVEEHIDDYTNSTYGGLATVTGEIYDPADNDKVQILDKQPVREVDTVYLNRPTESSGNPNYVSLTEGLADDYSKYKNLGVRFSGNGKSPNGEPQELKFDYKYGYEDVPSDLENAATEMVVDDLVRGTVSGAQVDGRDNFDPQTVNVNVTSYQSVLDRYKLDKMTRFSNLVQEGTIT